MDFDAPEIPDDLTTWIGHIVDANNTPQRQERRIEFMEQVHGIPNGSAQKYNVFFEKFKGRFRGYQKSHVFRMITTPADFYHLVDELKRLHIEQVGPTWEQSIRPTFEELVHSIQLDPYFQDPDIDPPEPGLIKVERSIWLGMWAWLQVSLLRKVPGGVRRLFDEGGQILHPCDSDESVWIKLKKDLPYLPAGFLGRHYHEFSMRLNLEKLREPRINFYPTSNILEHLRISKDAPGAPDGFGMDVYVFHDKSMLYALLKGNNGANPKWYKDLAQETLNTLVLLGAYDVDGAITQFRRAFHVNLLEPMDDELGEAPTTIYITRSLHNYPNWGARLLALEEAVKGQEPSTFNEYAQEQRDKKNSNITLWAFILSVILLLLALISAVTGSLAVEEADKANAYASIASVAADSGANETSSLLGCAIPYFCQATGMNRTSSILNSATTPFVVTITDTAFVTTTITQIVNITEAP